MAFCPFGQLTRILTSINCRQSAILFTQIGGKKYHGNFKYSGGSRRGQFHKR